MNDKRYEQGLSAYASQLQMSPEQVEAWFFQHAGERFGKESILSAADGWVDDELSLRERSMIVIACLITQGGADQQLQSHTRWAIRHGCNRAQLEALAALLRVYAGGPRASNAVTVIREELARLEAQE